MILLRLFLSFAYIGTLAFGGGYATLPLIQNQCVDVNGWLSMLEFSDLLTISQITPGPIAINSATFVGMKVAGVLGAVAASIGFLMPPFIVMTVFYWLYKKYGQLSVIQNVMSGLKPGVVALIALAGLDVIVEAIWGVQAPSLQSLDIFSAVLALCAFFILRKWKLGAIQTILACGAIGVLEYVILSFVV